MEFLVKLEVHVPEGTPQSAVEERHAGEALASAKLADQATFSGCG